MAQPAHPHPSLQTLSSAARAPNPRTRRPPPQRASTQPAPAVPPARPRNPPPQRRPPAAAAPPRAPPPARARLRVRHRARAARNSSSAAPPAHPLGRRDLLCGIGKGDEPPPEQRPGQLRKQMEEVELSLGLSLGGRFGLDRKGDKLPWSSSVAAMLTPLVEVPAPRALPRTSSLPVLAEASKVGRQQGQAGWGSCLDGGGLGVEHAARLPASGSPSSASSGGDGQRLQGTLMRTSSLPAVIEAAGNDEWKKPFESIATHGHLDLTMH
ncbi:unnamed protein product [Miscanthus lutarioriparius]|uniref:Ninja-family protein n=1 Tax=Miscanthus lutarioriparius TaxID=422564 RepID=A0A811QDR6_9POAL|nr:unnamed protein product [Miscanthus lutarioriparius]